MRLLVALLFFLRAPFWDNKPAESWTAREIESLRTDSPWAQYVGPRPEVLVYLATAPPILDAEAEARYRSKESGGRPGPDYSYYLIQNQGKCLVVAIPYQARIFGENASDLRRMEADSVMIVGRRQYRLIGHFPPDSSDPVLRLVFPREVEPSDKEIVFRLFLPGLTFPEREVVFAVKDLFYRGKLAL